ncbi:MAG TPA: hypothetical protein VJ436_07895 [Anaerolineales bacterium]|nr:hypothetical protein [Anaerolineales bacterium]
MRTIRASDIGAYLYCRRAWYYQQQGLKPVNQAELATGSEIHERHGRSVLFTSCLRVLAYMLLLAALALFAVYATNLLL